MTKQQRQIQQETNEIIMDNYVIALDEFSSRSADCEMNSKRLRSCNAMVYETDNYYFLVSYSTMVAFISKATRTGFDILRYVYGFTNTSSQHISKFFNDFPVAVSAYSDYLTEYKPAGVQNAYRYYPV